MAKRNSKRKRTTRTNTNPSVNDVVFDPSHGDAGTPSSRVHEYSIQRKVRKGTEMFYLWGMEPGQKLPVELNENGCPIRMNDNSSYFSRFLGTVARRSYLCPISYLQWDHIPKEKLDSIWAVEIESRFYFTPADYISNIKEWSFEEVNNMWLQWKSTLKRLYFNYRKSEDANVEVITKQEPYRVDVAQYRILVKYWLSNEGKAEGTEGIKPVGGMLYAHTKKIEDVVYINTVPAQTWSS